ncbi:hypothetical protein [Rhodospirillum centenum]|uniref:Uncharacterized protein n=1 Tax=Rhodospirillum centenum (strain ATCC 51521 / SW) TaxID=414684 RepID=B6INN3_RHOCS|nr:hypothetical protein [Rhodospirillum centenum]ACI99217.1 conserved hypothetical protein [Rhodospirillum centenum SW]
MTRPVRIRGIEDARLVLGVARDCGCTVVLVSPAGAAGYLGGGWWAALTALLRQEFPGTEITAVLDCADDPGHVLAALRAGCTELSFAGPPEVVVKLADIAAQHGARLHPPAADAVEPWRERIPRAALHALLAGPGTAPADTSPPGTAGR